MSDNIMDQTEDHNVQTENLDEQQVEQNTEQQEEQPDEIDYEELERRLEEEAERELYESIRNKTSKLDLDSLMTKRKPVAVQKMTRHKPSNVMSLSQLNSKMDEAAPKKFTSKRADEKRKQLGIDEKPQYRKFNARKEPYNFVNKIKTKQVVSLDTTDFPSL
jgi:hypothetical protein